MGAGSGFRMEMEMETETETETERDITACRCFLLDWGNTVMTVFADERGPMYRWSRVEAVKGARPLLQRLSGAGACYLATNAADSGSAEIRKALSRVGLDRFFSGILCSRELGYEKPSAEFYRAAVEKTGCRPGQILMIGDSLENDVLAALCSGIDAVWYNPSGLPVPAGIRSVRALDELLQ